MDKQFLFENEEILLAADNNTVVLTNKRIRLTVSSFGKSHTTSMHLENISTIEIHYRSWLVVLIFGILLAIACLLLGGNYNNDGQLAGLAVSAFCVLLYFITRRHLITIASNGGAKINILTKGMGRETVLDFVNKIEHAKSLIK